MNISWAPASPRHGTRVWTYVRRTHKSPLDRLLARLTSIEVYTNHSPLRRHLHLVEKKNGSAEIFKRGIWCPEICFPKSLETEGLFSVSPIPPYGQVSSSNIENEEEEQTQPLGQQRTLWSRHVTHWGPTRLPGNQNPFLKIYAYVGFEMPNASSLTP